jgi:hypothetical protein
MSLGRDIYRLGYEGSPIILTGGIANLIPGGMLPIIALTESINFAFGLLGGEVSSIDNLFAHWQVLPGTMLQRNSIGMYPFANQVIAANAIIREPLNISMMMICPVQRPGGYFTKLATLAALKTTLDFHNQNGGTYTVVTPSYIYTGCIIQGIIDTTSNDSVQVQTMWQFDFLQPLISSQEATKIGSVLSSVDGGLPIQGELSWSGVGTSIGNTLSGFANSIPGLSDLIGSMSGGA